MDTEMTPDEAERPTEAPLRGSVLDVDAVERGELRLIEDWLSANLKGFAVREPI